MDKSPDAFRTISEVADYLDTPAHVLRFWESRFPQIRPVKRAGGRRYYRPADVALLTGIKRLLHDEGLTIRGVQKILREHGVRHVAGLAGEVLPEVDQDAEAALEAALAANFGLLDDEAVTPAVAESATVVALETALRRTEPALVAPAAAPEPVPEAPSLFDIEPETEADPTPAPSVFRPPYTVSLPEALDLASDGEDEAPGLADRLRALPPGALAARAPELRALHARLTALQARLARG